MKKPENYLIILNEIKPLAAQLHASIEDGSFYRLPFRKRHALIKKIKKLYNRLAGTGFSIDLKKLFATTSLSASLTLLWNSCLPPEPKPPNPRFHFIGANPFGLSPYIYGNNAVSLSFADIDNDGDSDLFLSSYDNYSYGNIMKYYENKDISGNDKELNSPYFKEGDPSTILEIDTERPASGLSIVKGDRDGDFHVFIGVYKNDYMYSYGNIFYCKYDSEIKDYIDQQMNPFGLDVPGENDFLSPFLIDIDGDNDSDAFVGAGYGSIYYFKGVKSDDQPFLFTLEKDINIGHTFDYIIPALADIDRDGDPDLFIGKGEYIQYSYNNRIYYFENKGSNKNPDFHQPDKEPDFITDVNMMNEYYHYLAPAFVDADGDADLDLFIGYTGEYQDNGYGGILYFENSDID
jgi:hypothetical protein